MPRKRTSKAAESAAKPAAAKKTKRVRSPRKSAEAKPVEQQKPDAQPDTKPAAKRERECDVQVADQNDDVLLNAYGGCYVATCKTHGLSSSVRSTEDRARTELAELCAAKRGS